MASNESDHSDLYELEVALADKIKEVEKLEKQIDLQSVELSHLKAQIAEIVKSSQKAQQKLDFLAYSYQSKIDNFDIVASAYQFGRLDFATLALTVVAVVVSIGALAGFRFVKAYATNEAVEAATTKVQEELGAQIRTNRHLIYSIAYDAANDALEQRDFSDDWENVEGLFGEGNGEED